MSDRNQHAKSLLVRWTVVLAIVLAATLWSTLRMSAARRALEQQSSSADTMQANAQEAVIDHWTCTMHPEIRQSEKGKCPICGMELVPKYIGSDEPGVKPKLTPASDFPATSHFLRELHQEKQYMCTMPECNDTPSTDANSRCPVCGMKREEIDTDMGRGLGDDELRLDERSRKLAEVAVETVQTHSLFKHIRTVGKATYDETRHRMVTAWIAGRIDSLFADYTGMVVKKGDHLIELYSPDLVTAQEELLTALRSTSQLTQATPAARTRSDRLVKSAERQLELLGITAEQIQKIKAQGTASTRLTVYAPIGGTVVRKPAMEGMYVNVGDPLYEIADLDHVWLQLDLYESDLPWIAPLQTVRVTADALPGHEFTGQIAFVDPVVDPRTRTIKVRVNVRNRDGLLKPEMFVNANIKAALADAASSAVPKAEGKYVCPMHPWNSSDTVGQCDVCGMRQIPVEELPGYRTPREAAAILAVPRQAVLQTGQRSLVYLESAPGIYRPAEIEVGPLAEDGTGREYYPVSAGLLGSERVVVRGNFAIDSQMQLAGKKSLFNPASGTSSVSDHHQHGAAQSSGDAVLPSSQMEDDSDAADLIEQTICPVMENEIDDTVFVDFHGVRVQFCCPPCIKRFTSNPQEYLPKLPMEMQKRIRKAMNKSDSEHNHG